MDLCYLPLKSLPFKTFTMSLSPYFRARSSGLKPKPYWGRTIHLLSVNIITISRCPSRTAAGKGHSIHQVSNLSSAFLASNTEIFLKIPHKQLYRVASLFHEYGSWHLLWNHFWEGILARNYRGLRLDGVLYKVTGYCHICIPIYHIALERRNQFFAARLTSIVGRAPAPIVLCR